MNTIYLDNAATTPLDEQVTETMHEVMRHSFGNPSSVHVYGRTARVIIEDARKKIARLAGVAPGSIFFTSCGTEAINMAITGAVKNCGIVHIITSPVEHHAVLHSAEHAGPNVRISFVKLLPDGHIDFSHLEQLLAEPGPALVALMHANNEIGNLLSVKECSELCKKHNALFLCDTVQTLGKYEVDLGKHPIHFASCSAHKFHGPKGIGFIYISPEISIDPLLHGGGQERNMRSGTENIYGIAGMAKALEIALTDTEQKIKYISSLKERMAQGLEKNFPGIRFNGDCRSRGLYTVLNVTFPRNKHAEMLLQNLDIHGIAVSGGSACTSGVVHGSHVLNELGVDASLTSVRFSFSRFNTEHEIDFTLNKLTEILNK